MSVTSPKVASPKKSKPSLFGYLHFQFKLWRNRRAQSAGKPEPYAINPFERYRQRRPDWTLGPARSLRRFNDLPATVKAAVYAFVGILAVVSLFGASFDWGGVTTELWGLLAEVLVLGIVIFYVGEKSQASQFIARQHELISDFRYWNSDEAKFRILGAVRRLQECGITKVDLTGVRLSDARMEEHGIRDLSKAKLSGGLWMATIGVRAVSKFDQVDFSHCSCEETQFSVDQGFMIGDHRLPWKSQGTYTDCTFIECDLTGAKFEEAELIWTSLPPEKNYEHIDDDETGAPIFNQNHYGPFYRANLSGVSFRYARFVNADFRDVGDIESCDFTGAEGLETCVFDSDELKAKIITKAVVEKK